MLAKASLNDHIERLAGLEGRQLIATVNREFNGRVAVLSSFGVESAVLLHMVSEVSQGMPVVFLDTLKLFPETLAYRDALVEYLGLRDLRVVMPEIDDITSEDREGDLHEIDPDACCHIRKTRPMNRALAEFDVIISGRKRFHGAARSDLQFVNVSDGKIKIEPLAGFTSLDLHAYMQRHHLPSHPLKFEGYRSVGCKPCTKRGGSDDNPREGRWSGTEKTECGIHFTANGTVVRTILRQTAAA
jgi:phosphoadenosine phosphosulfate reductase